jgi:hypothetical protein
VVQKEEERISIEKESVCVEIKEREVRKRKRLMGAYEYKEN